MGGLSRSYEGGEDARVAHWLEVAADSGMPIDPRLWTENPLSGTYPACIAVKAAAEQGEEAESRYLRALREGLMFERRKLDHAEALIALAGEVGLDRARFELDVRSNAILERFGADLERARDVSEGFLASGRAADDGQGGERYPFPTLIFIGPDGARTELSEPLIYDRCRQAAIDAGAEPANPGRMTVEAALERFGRCAVPELEALTGMARPPLMAELWAGAREWRLRPTETVTGTLWQLA